MEHLRGGMTITQQFYEDEEGEISILGAVCRRGGRDREAGRE